MAATYIADPTQTDPRETKSSSFLLHPQRVWWRKALFQVNLWVGLILGIYVLLIGGSGSIVVLEEEFTRLSRPELFRAGAQNEPLRYDARFLFAFDLRLGLLHSRIHRFCRNFTLDKTAAMVKAIVLVKITPKFLLSIIVPE